MLSGPPFLNQERLVGWIRAGGMCVRVGELILKREGHAGSRGGCLKKGG